MLIPLAMGLLDPDGDGTADPAGRRGRSADRHAGGRGERPETALRLRGRAGPPVPSLLRGFLGAGQAQGRAARSAEISCGARLPTPSPAGKPASRSRPRCSLEVDGAMAARRAAGSTPISSRRCGDPRRRRWRPGLRRRGADAAERRHPRRPDAGRGCRRDPRRARAGPRRDRRSLGPHCVPRYDALTRCRPLPHRRRLDRPAGVAQCLPRLSRRPGEAAGAALAKAQFDAGHNMTDVLAALAVLSEIDCPERDEALDAF